VNYVTGEEEAYWIQSDPDEVHNLGAHHPRSTVVVGESEVVEQLKRSGGAAAREIEDKPLIEYDTTER
jgi:hypothetical protein